MRVTVVGLGPGPAEWVSPAARARLLTPSARVFVRTAVHPAVPELLQGVAFESFDALYEHEPTVETVHAAIAERLLASGDAGGDVALAVPGDGALGEGVLERLRSGGAELAIVPAAVVSPGSGGRPIELNPHWPAVVVGVYNRRLAGDLKLALQQVYPTEHGVVGVHHPGLPDQQVHRLAL